MQIQLLFPCHSFVYSVYYAPIQRLLHVFFRIQSFRSRLPSESPPRSISRSPPKRTRKSEYQKTSEREREKFRDAEHSRQKEGRNERIESRGIGGNGRKDSNMERLRGEEREREKPQKGL